MDKDILESINEVLSQAKELKKEAYLGLSLEIGEVEFLTSKLNLAENAGVTGLTLVQCDLDVRGAHAISSFFKKNTTLTSFHLTQNDLCEQGVAAIANGLCFNTTLQSLELSYCDISSAASLVELVVANRTLKRLLIPGNHIGDLEGVKLLEVAVDSKSLTELSLYDTALTNAAIPGIVSALRRNSCLRKLDLGHHKFGFKEFTLLAGLVREDHVLRNLSLHACYETTAESVIAVAQALTFNKTLRVMNWPGFPNECSIQVCSRELERNGALVDCGRHFSSVCARNHKMHHDARQALLALLMIRRFCKSPLSAIPVDVVLMIAKMIWHTRTDVDTWAAASSSWWTSIKRFVFGPL